MKCWNKYEMANDGVHLSACVSGTYTAGRVLLPVVAGDVNVA